MYRRKFTHKFTCCPCRWCLCVFCIQHGSAQKLKPSKASVDAMDIMKLAGGIVGGVFVKDYVVYKKRINE